MAINYQNHLIITLLGYLQDLHNYEHCLLICHYFLAFGIFSLYYEQNFSIRFVKLIPTHNLSDYHA